MRNARLFALIYKESLHIVRDPSALVIAFVLPVVLLFLFVYAVSLDMPSTPIGLIQEARSEKAHALASAFRMNPYFEVHTAPDRGTLYQALAKGEVRAILIIPEDFDQRFAHLAEQELVQWLTDGSQVATARLITAYAEGLTRLFVREEAFSKPALILLEARFWFNTQMASRRSLIPGAISIVMTMIGTLLTALVIAKEWERGTMESLLSTPVSIIDLLLGKLIPFFVLGMLALFLCVFLARVVFGLALEGSFFALISSAALFMLAALGQGLLISTLAKNQFVAAQAAVISGFLPSFLLSGFLYEIDAMPAFLQVITNFVAAKHFNTCLQTIFLAGDVWSLLRPKMGALCLIALFFFGFSYKKMSKTLA